MTRDMATHLAIGLVAGLVAVAPRPVLGQACISPTLRSINIDGDLSDWAEVLANPDNTSRDGDGSTVACAVSTDLDCSVPRQQDLTRFAWTSDGVKLFLYFERQSTSSGTDSFVVYLDLDTDGLMESTDLVLAVELSDTSRSNSGDVLGYVPANLPGGDPLVGANGLADGWEMPGGAIARGGSGRVGAHGPRGGAAEYEVSVKWTDLGVPAGSPLLAHVSLGRGSTLPGLVDDNMGGRLGGAVDTGYHALWVGPPYTRGTAPGATVTLDHVVVNAGNLPTLVDITGTTSAGHDITWRADLNSDGLYETLLAFDAGGDGILTSPGDVLDPAGDGNGDGALDVGVMPAASTMALQLAVSIPASDGGVTGTVDITTWADDEPACRASVSNLLRVGEITIARDERRFGVPGQAAWLPHVVQNNLTTTATVDFSSISVGGWSYAFFADPNQDGSPTDAAPLADSNGDGQPDITLSPDEAGYILARASVPAAASLGQTEMVFLRAHLAGPPVSSVTDRITLGNTLLLAPSYLRSDGTARYGAIGGSIYFAHQVMNAGSAQVQFDLSAVSDLGWPVTLLSDPNADGRPYDSLPLPPGGIIADINGGSVPFIVRVDVPTGALLGDTSRLTIEARGVDDPSVFEQVGDDAVVAVVRVFDEPGRVASISSVAPCGTAYSLASGLPPSAPDYRFSWRNGAGVLIRSSLVTSSAQGDCSDELSLVPADVGPGWSVAIEHLELGTWVTLDVTTFEVDDGLSPVVLVMDARAYDITDSSLSAALVVENTSFDSPVTGQSLRWAVRTPDGSQVLLQSGTWTTWTGGEATQLDSLNLLPGETHSFLLAVASLTFPGLGSYSLQVFRSSACGTVESLLTEISFLVTNDPDGDGLPTVDELAAGSDPTDADSDDDGVPDAQDGLGDIDGDGLIDAIDCDSDDDGLPDGLEVGLVAPGADTDVAGGCFRADADPTTATDPDAADSDGGGVPDGVEDINADGARDPGEADPLDTTDDATVDSDGDTLPDLDEAIVGTDRLDPDTDDDGILDGLESRTGVDIDGDGLASALDCDSDGDGLPDGLESGVSAAGIGTDVAAGCFAADQDPATRTDPELADSDGGGVPDGEEDANGNGALDSRERDPASAVDDSCLLTPPAEIQDLRVTHSGDVAHLTWTGAADACTTYVVEESATLTVMNDLATGLSTPMWSDTTPLGSTGLRYYRIRADSTVSGPGQ